MIRTDTQKYIDDFAYLHYDKVTYYDMSVKSKFCHSLMYPNCYIAMQFPQFSNTSNSHKMPYSQHFITFSVFGVSISLKCSFVQAQSHFGLLTLTSYYKKAATGQLFKNAMVSTD